MYTESIGLVGGFGAYATLNFYKRILEVFASESERNYPHIYMDNDFTMPSRTRALLYGEGYDEVVNGISESIAKMCLGGVNHIVLVCGTAHAFLEDVYKNVPEAKDKVINIIDELNTKLLVEEVKSVLVIAAEGTLKQHVYEDKLTECNCISPEPDEYGNLRYFIECVKQHNVTDSAILKFKDFLESYSVENVVLGCTEFPVLLQSAQERFPEYFNGYNFWDPLEITLEKLKKIIR